MNDGSGEVAVVLIQRLLTFARALWCGLLMAAGFVSGQLLFRQRPPRRPLVAFQTYAVHLAYFYQTLIGRLLRDDRVDVVLLTWPHPQFPLREQARLRELAVSVLGLGPLRVRPLWKAMWWKFDLMITCDALMPPLVSRTRTCQLFHGAMVQERHFRRLLFRPEVFDYDLVFAFGSYTRDIILAHKVGSRGRPRICVTGSPQLDKYFHPEKTTEEYLHGLGLDRSRPIILYAPHWSELNLAGRSGLQLLHQTAEELQRLPVSVIVKLHAMSFVPGAAHGRPWQELLGQVETAKVKVDCATEDVDALLAADVLVTGISSRAYNFMLLDKPVVLYRPDLVPQYYKGQTAYDMLRKAAWLAESAEDLGVCVQRALDNPQAHREQRAAIRETFFANPGHATEEVTRILYEEIEAGRSSEGGAAPT